MKTREFHRLLICIIISICFCGCYTLAGHPGVSETINESKKNGSFICELSTDINPYKVNDTLSLSFNEMWIEYPWLYGGTIYHVKAEILKDSGYTICARLRNSLKGYTSNWVIANDNFSCFGLANDSNLVADIKLIPKSKSFHFIIRESTLTETTLGKKIGEISFRIKGKVSNLELENKSLEDQ